MSVERQPKKEEDKLLETEIKVTLTEEQRAGIIDQITALGAEYQGIEEITDIYYCPNDVTSFSELEMDEVGSFSVRLREKKENGESEVEWNIKQITEEGDHSAWAEYEVGVTSLDTADQMMKIMGYKPFININKKRTKFSLADKKGKNYKLLVEDIADFGPAIEFETFSVRNEVAASKQFIHGVIADLGLSTDQIAPKSVTNTIMRQQARF